jgi:hypothetical protein
LSGLIETVNWGGECNEETGTSLLSHRGVER